jgi:hypothetical protein
VPTARPVSAGAGGDRCMPCSSTPVAASSIAVASRQTGGDAKSYLSAATANNGSSSSVANNSPASSGAAAAAAAATQTVAANPGAVLLQLLQTRQR